MSISAIGQAYSTSWVYSVSYHSSSGKNAGTTSAKSNSPKDTATISEAAKELAAQKSGATSQEEANESAAEKVQEQSAGLQ